MLVDVDVCIALLYLQEKTLIAEACKLTATPASAGGVDGLRDLVDRRVSVRSVMPVTPLPLH